jgi:hypothetical protein
MVGQRHEQSESKTVLRVPFLQVLPEVPVIFDRDPAVAYAGLQGCEGFVCETFDLAKGRRFASAADCILGQVFLHVICKEVGDVLVRAMPKIERLGYRYGFGLSHVG